MRVFQVFFSPVFFLNMFLGCEGGRELVPMGLQTFMATSVGRKKTPENECGTLLYSNSWRKDRSFLMS